MNLLEILKKNADNAKSYIDGLVSKKQDTLTFDTAPTEGSQNPVTSDGIQKAIAAKTVDLSNYPTKDGIGATGNWSINAATATKATQDASGNVIADTYVPHYVDIGDMGLDLNALKFGGLYTASSSDVATAEQHYPEAGRAGSLVAVGNTNGCTQIYTTYDTHNSYIRAYSPESATWSKWDTLVLMSDLTSKQDKLTFDATPTANSSNPVTSDGVKKYVDSALAALISADDKSY